MVGNTKASAALKVRKTIYNEYRSMTRSPCFCDVTPYLYLCYSITITYIPLQRWPVNFKVSQNSYFALSINESLLKTSTIFCQFDINTLTSQETRFVETQFRVCAFASRTHRLLKGMGTNERTSSPNHSLRRGLKRQSPLTYEQKRIKALILHLISDLRVAPSNNITYFSRKKTK